MTEEERLKYIAEKAKLHLEDYLGQLERDEITELDLLANLYGAMVAASLLSYNLNLLATEASNAAAKILAIHNEQENSKLENEG